MLEIPDHDTSTLQVLLSKVSELANKGHMARLSVSASTQLTIECVRQLVATSMLQNLPARRLANLVLAASTLSQKAISCRFRGVSTTVFVAFASVVLRNAPVVEHAPGVMDART